jgi:RNA polymerase sigma-70 factor, ECF subfamily
MSAPSLGPGKLDPDSVVCGNGRELVPAVDTVDSRLVGDRELLYPLRASECSEIGALFERYSRLVLAIASRVLGDASEAEEVVQEVFLYLYRKPSLFDPCKGSLKAWIVQLTLSRALDRKSYLRRRRWWAADIESLELPQRTDLETQIEARLNRKHLERALAGLSQMQRRTIECFYFDGLDLREISQQLSQPIGNVRHHFYRGLRRLRQSAVIHSLRCK